MLHQRNGSALECLYTILIIIIPFCIGNELTTPEEISVKKREQQKSREESGRVLHYLKLPRLLFLSYQGRTRLCLCVLQSTNVP